MPDLCKDLRPLLTRVMLAEPFLGWGVWGPLLTRAASACNSGSRFPLQTSRAHVERGPFSSVFDSCPRAGGHPSRLFQPRLRDLREVTVCQDEEM